MSATVGYEIERILGYEREENQKINFRWNELYVTTSGVDN